MKTRSKSLFNIFTLFALLASLLGSAVSVTPAFAISINYTVNTTADTDDGSCDPLGTGSGNKDCTLREALSAANAHGTPQIDTITLPAGTYTLTLTGADEDVNATGDLDITDSVTITGAGAGTTIIQASTCNPVTLIDSVSLATNCTPATDRVMYAASGKTVAISGVTIRHGKINTDGGGIENFSTLTLTNSTVSNNSASIGGGIQNYSNTLMTLTNSTVSNNSGSGIYNETGRTLEITGSTISGNSSSGIYNIGTLTVTNSALSGNSADALGGAILNNNGGTATVTGSTISGNTGGGIYNNETLTVNGGSTISNNIGGGIDNRKTLTVTNSTISGNHDTQQGGGINNQDSTSTVAITGSTISGNSANFAGGIFNSGTLLTLTNSTVSGNSATGVSNSSAGGIENNNSSSTLTITNSTISNNSAVFVGGGINSKGPMTITNSTISGNSASDSFSGGINISSSSTAAITNSTISGNSADAGGGITIGGGSTLNLTNSTLSGNTAASFSGGITNFGTLNYANTIIANSGLQSDCANFGGTIGTNTNNLVEDGTCSASLSGDPKLAPLANNGGATKTHALLLGSPAMNAGNDPVCSAAPVSNLDQRGNTRSVSYLHCDIGAYEYVDKTTFVVNTNDDLTDDAFCDASDCSLREAIYAANGSPAADMIIFANALLPITLGSQLPPVTSTIIITGKDTPNTIIQADAAANTATYRVFEVGSAGDLTLDSLTVQNGRCNGSCLTDPNKGGGIYNGGALTVINSTFSNNSSASNGGGIYDHGSAATITNSTFSGNSATGDGGGIYNYGSTLLTVTNSTFSGNIATGGGGIYNYGSASIILKNSILANSTASEDCVVNYPTFFNTNLIESHNNCGTPVSTADPMLGLLADNGGPTRTMALDSGSPAIDAGSNTFCPAADQRGVSRPKRICDIGAVEQGARSTSAPDYDGWTLESKETSNIANTKMSTGSLRVGDDAKNRQYRSLLYFDTAYIPNNAVITKAVVRIKKEGFEGDDPLPTLPALPTHGNLVADMKKGTFGLAALQTGDFSALAAPINTAGKFNPSTPPDDWYTLTLSPTNFKYINLVGATQFRVRFAKDDNNDKDADFITFFGDGSGVNAPQFTIEYSVP